VGKHLRESGRHAIAHAQGDIIINPDDPQDARRLKAELPIIEGLAELAIEEHLGVLSKWRIYREHLYELRGWKHVIGDQLIADVISGKEIPEGTQIDVPDLNIRLRKRDPYQSLEGMSCLNIAVVDDKFELAFRSACGLVDFLFQLNFQAERLEFQGIFQRDDGSVVAAENAKDIIRFNHEYFGNGQIQMWNSLTGVLVSRCDAFMPVDAYLNLEAAKMELAAADQVIADRKLAAAEQI
jgi:hypothetical protein